MRIALPGLPKYAAPAQPDHGRSVLLVIEAKDEDGGSNVIDELRNDTTDVFSKVTKEEEE